MVKLKIGSLFMIGIIAIIGIYLFGIFTVETEEGREFVLPPQADLEESTLWAIRVLIVGAGTFLGYSIIMKLSGTPMNRKHVLTLMITGVAVYFLWTYLLEPIFNTESLTNIAWGTGEKLGLFKP